MMDKNNKAETPRDYVNVLEKDNVMSISGGYSDWARRTFVLTDRTDELFRGVGRVFFSDHPEQRTDAAIYNFQIDKIDTRPTLSEMPNETNNMTARLLEAYVHEDRDNQYKNIFIESSGKMISLNQFIRNYSDQETLRRIEANPKEHKKMLPITDVTFVSQGRSGGFITETMDDRFCDQATKINILSKVIEQLTLEKRYKESVSVREQQLEAIYIIKKIADMLPDSPRKKEYMAKDAANMEALEMRHMTFLYSDMINDIVGQTKNGKTALHFTMTKKKLAEETLTSYNHVLDRYGDIRQILKGMPNFSEAVPFTKELQKEFGSTYLISGGLKKVSFECESGKGRLVLPTYKNNINEHIFKKDFAKLPIDDCLAIWRQVSVLDQFTLNQLAFFKKHQTEFTTACEKYTLTKTQGIIAQQEQAQKDIEEKRRKAAEIQEKVETEKQKADFVKKLPIKDGNMFAIKRSPHTINTTAVSTSKEGTANTASNNESPAKRQRELTRQIYARNKSLESEFHTGRILYEKIGINAEFENLVNQDEMMQAVLNGHEPDTYSEYRMVYETPVGTVESNGSKNIEDMYDSTLPSKYKTQLAAIPTGFPVWSDFQQGFLECERIDGTSSIESSLHKNSAIYRFRVDNQDGSNGKYKTTQEMVEALRQGYGYDEMLKDFDNIDSMEKRKHDVSVFLYDKKLGALQVVVWAREQTEGIKDVKKHLAALPDLKDDGFSVLGIKVDAKSIEDTIFGLTPKREEAINTLVGQISKMRETSASCAALISQTIKLLGEIPPNIGEKARAEFDNAVRGGAINRLEKMQLLKLRMAELKRLWSQIKINGEKLNESGIIRSNNTVALPVGGKKEAKIS